jgi:hypothetical protein
MIENGLQPLVDAYQNALPEVIYEFNKLRLPQLEGAWGREFSLEFENESQKTVEITKQYTRPLNNCFYKHIKGIENEFVEDTTNGYDYRYNEYLIEDKNSFSSNNNWVGNGFAKSDWHILKKFSVDESGRIVKAFLCLVNIRDCSGEWSDKTVNTNRSILQLSKDDVDKIHIIHGSLTIPKASNGKYARPVMEAFDGN